MRRATLRRVTLQINAQSLHRRGGSHVQVEFFATYVPARQCRTDRGEFRSGHDALFSCRDEEEQTIAAAKAVGKADVNGMIWSPYLVPMKPVIAEFTKETGIGIGAVQDIS